MCSIYLYIFNKNLYIYSEGLKDCLVRLVLVKHILKSQIVILLHIGGLTEACVTQNIDKFRICWGTLSSWLCKWHVQVCENMLNLGY